MDDVKLIIKGKEDNVYTIHYSCNGFYDGGAIAPSICSVSVVHCKTKEIKTFGLHKYISEGKCINEAEHLLLNDFCEFFNTLNSPFFVHWSMDSLPYGFKAIYSRCENFGIDFNLNNIEHFDLCSHIPENLLSAMEHNNCKRITVMSGKEELETFKKRDFASVQNSTEAKAIGMSELFDKYIGNELLIKIVS